MPFDDSTKLTDDIISSIIGDVIQGGVMENIPNLCDSILEDENDDDDAENVDKIDNDIYFKLHIVGNLS